MNVLVTGGAGYIGSHACVELLNAGHSVVVVDNLVNANAECLRRVERITGKTLEYHEMDLLNRAALNELFDTHRFDCVLHFAGLKAVGESVQQPLRYYNNNLGTTIHLCQTMAAHGVKKILFSSSATVYSPNNTMPVDESARTGGCTNPYGWTKYMSEQILSDTAKADGEWTVMLLRYFNPVGAHPSGLIGEDPRGIPNNLMPYITQVAIGRRAYSATTIPHRTARACATICTSSISRAAMSRRWTIWRSGRAFSCSISAPATATACSTWCMPLKRRQGRRSPTRSPRAAPETSPRCTATRARPSGSLAGRRNTLSRICAATAGTGRAKTRTGSRNKASLPEGDCWFCSKRILCL